MVAVPGNVLCYDDSSMFAGLLDQQIVYSSHPFIVVERDKVSGSFAALSDAEGFITKQASYRASIYAHRDSKWVIVRGPRINPLLGSTAKKTSASRRVSG